MSHKPTTWWSKIGVAAAIVGIFAFAHGARQDVEVAKSSDDPTATVPYNALQIAVAEDGQLVSPSKEDAAALRSEMVERVRSARRVAPAAERHDDGTLSMVVGFDQMNFLTVQRDEDRTLTMDHAEGSTLSAREDER